MQHSYGTKHPLVYRLSNHSLHCYKCNESLTEGINGFDPDRKKNARAEKVIEWHNRIVELAEGLDQKAPVIPEPKKKKQETKEEVECEVKPEMKQRAKTVNQFKQPKEENVKEES